jgi:hypothetical protein
MNVKAKKNLARNVHIVDSQISLSVCLFSDSSETCIPNASEKASAIAMVSIPPIITSCECVPAWSPTIKPKVVIIPEVVPKQTPVLKDSLINLIKILSLKI